MNKNLINIEILSNSQISVGIVSGYFDENGLSATVYISPVMISDLINIDKIKFLKINQILWKVEGQSLEDHLPPDFPPCLHKFILNKVL